MITGVGFVSVLANDAKKSAEWYRDKLGFDIVMSEGHLVFVKPKGPGTTVIHLCGRCKDWGEDRPGGRVGIWLQSGEAVDRVDSETGLTIFASDPSKVEETYAELKRNGIEFSEELSTTSWGKMAIMKDLDGNEFELS